MTPIENIRFDPPIGFQTSGGPGWKSEIVTLASGRETRNALWSRPLRKWQVMGVPLSEHAASELLRFFNARFGAAQGFRFSDPFGHSTARPGNSVSPLDEPLGIGDGETTQFQLNLDDGASAKRVITRPVAGSVRVAVDGAETTDFSVDDETGEISFASPPVSAAILTAGFTYDVPVRFETDTLELSQSGKGAFQLVRLSLVELREGG